MLNRKVGLMGSAEVESHDLHGSASIMARLGFAMACTENRCLLRSPSVSRMSIFGLEPLLFLPPDLSERKEKEDFDRSRCCGLGPGDSMEVACA